MQWYEKETLNETEGRNHFWNVVILCWANQPVQYESAPQNLWRKSLWIRLFTYVLFNFSNSLATNDLFGRVLYALMYTVHFSVILFGMENRWMLTCLLRFDLFLSGDLYYRLVFASIFSFHLPLVLLCFYVKKNEFSCCMFLFYFLLMCFMLFNNRSASNSQRLLRNWLPKTW